MELEVPDLESVSPAKELIELMNVLEKQCGYMEGDINWSGVQNIALDLRGQQLFIDYFENPDIVHHLFGVISKTIVKVVTYIRKRTGTSSISVNPMVSNFDPQINLHSNCSVTMISEKTYEEYLLKYDNYLSEKLQPYGIHHCGNNAACKWLIEIAQVKTENLTIENNSQKLMHKNWKGAIRGEYRVANEKWDFFCPIWHTGQAIKALVQACEVLKRLIYPNSTFYIFYHYRRDMFRSCLLFRFLYTAWEE